MSRKKKILIGATVLILLLFFAIFGVYKWGANSQDAKIKNLTSRLDTETKKAIGWLDIAKAGNQKAQAALKEKDAEIAAKAAALADCEKKVAELTAPKPKAVVRRTMPKKVVAQAAPVPVPGPAPALAQTMVPAVATTATPQLILRINIVEWSTVFQGKSLLSRDIGPVIRQGLADGTVIRAKGPQNFVVNGANVVVNDGSAIVNPGTVSQATTMVVRPTDGAKFASPPNGLPLTTNPGELYGVVQSGVSEIWLNFILAPAAASSSPVSLPVKKENLGGPKGLPSLLLFLSNDGDRSRERI